MSNKSFLKIAVSLGILALLLAFLGVNFVPRISASSPAEERILSFSLQARPDYFNERYPRSIAPQFTYVGSDYIERHADALFLRSKYTGADWIERHPEKYYSGSDWVERHP